MVTVWPSEAGQDRAVATALVDVALVVVELLWAVEELDCVLDADEEGFEDTIALAPGCFVSSHLQRSALHRCLPQTPFGTAAPREPFK